MVLSNTHAPVSLHLEDLKPDWAALKINSSNDLPLALQPVVLGWRRGSPSDLRCRSRGIEHPGEEGSGTKVQPDLTGTSQWHHVGCSLTA